MRDARAIAFCIVTITLMAGVSLAVSQSYVVAFGLAGAYAAFVLTRPRMQFTRARILC